MTTAADPPRATPSYDGIYDVPEAARYLMTSSHGAVVYLISSRKLINWIRRGVATPALAIVPGRELLIEFEDLISMRVIAALRAASVSWPAIRRGEILFGKVCPYCHKVGIAPVDGVCSTDIVVAAPKSLEWLGFVLGVIASVDFIDYSDAGSKGTWMPRTSWKRMAQYHVVTPPDDVIAAFNSSVRPNIDSIVSATQNSRPWLINAIRYCRIYWETCHAIRVEPLSHLGYSIG